MRGGFEQPGQGSQRRTPAQPRAAQQQLGTPFTPAPPAASLLAQTSLQLAAGAAPSATPAATHGAGQQVEQQPLIAEAGDLRPEEDDFAAVLQASWGVSTTGACIIACLRSAVSGPIIFIVRKNGGALLTHALSCVPGRGCRRTRRTPCCWRTRAYLAQARHPAEGGSRRKLQQALSI